MSNDVKFGLLVGVVLTGVLALAFYRKEMGPSKSPGDKGAPTAFHSFTSSDANKQIPAPNKTARSSNRSTQH
jgi:hypothetical protein